MRNPWQTTDIKMVDWGIKLMRITWSKGRSTLNAYMCAQEVCGKDGKIGHMIRLY